MSDNTDQTFEYQEQILDDLDDIKGSLDEESDYYDEEYQKEVLSSLKSIKKSVESLNESNTVDIDLFDSVVGSRYEAIYNSSNNLITLSFTSSVYTYYCYDISDYGDIYYSPITDFSNVNFTSNVEPETFKTLGRDSTIDCTYYFKNGTAESLEKTISTPHDNFFYCCVAYPNQSKTPAYVKGVPISSGGDDPLPEEPVEVVTTSSAVIIEGLDNLTQITTFQSFCSSLLIGILLFLVFVKGLRK